MTALEVRHDLGKHGPEWIDLRTASPATRARARPPASQCLADFSWYKPNPASVPHAGIVGYLTRDTTGKRLMPAQCRSYLAGGKTVSLVGQDGKQQALRGAAGGREDARFYNAQADEDGAPLWLPLIYAVADFDASPSELRGPIREYVAAVLETLSTAAAPVWRPVGIYGGIRTIDYLHDQFGDLIALYWQTVAWSGGRVSPHAHLHQQAGAPWYPLAGATDDNLIRRPFARWGQSPDGLSVDDRAALEVAHTDLTTTTRLLGG